MEPMTMMAIGSVAAPIVGGLVGNLMGAGDRKNQRRMMADALNQLNSLGVPPDLSREILFKEFERAGIYTPQLEEDVKLAESEVAKIKEDPALRQQQVKALQQMQQRGQVGLSAEDRAALNQVRGEVQRDSEAKRQQIMQSMQARGMGGSGAELMAALQSAQGASDQAASGSDALMAQAQQRALQAISESGRMSGDIRQQDFGVESTRASAKDQLEQMRAQNSIARQRANVDRLNQGQMTNLSEQQRIQDQNTAMRNAELLRMRNAEGEFFDRKANLATNKANAMQGQAGFYGQQAQQSQNMGASIGTGLGTAGASMLGNEKLMDRMFGSSDKNKKKNVDYTDEDVTLWMDRISKLLKEK
jgi:hypothetical protein